MNNLFQPAAVSDAEQKEGTLMQGNENIFTLVSAASPEIDDRVNSLSYPVRPGDFFLRSEF